MICPSCKRGLPPGLNDRCPFCASLLAAPVEGALAPEPRLEPPARDKVEPLREIPGLRRRERTWKDEVRERVRQRRHQRSDGELPLFPPEEVEERRPDPSGEQPSAGDVVLRSSPPPPAPESPAPSPLAREPFENERAEEWPSLRPEPLVPGPVERPALLFERAQAAVVDLALLLGLWSVVVYFASRAAQVGAPGLLPSWPYLAAYLTALGLIYAGYFTGTTGQTLGKIALGLRVVDPAGHPPGYLRACLRALVGSAGILLGGGGLVPMLLDPARRALHDRLLRTRVVKI